VHQRGIGTLYFIITAFITLKTAVFVPMPSASEQITAAAKPGLFAKILAA